MSKESFVSCLGSAKRKFLPLFCLEDLAIWIWSLVSIVGILWVELFELELRRLNNFSRFLVSVFISVVSVKGLQQSYIILI